MEVFCQSRLFINTTILDQNIRKIKTVCSAITQRDCQRSVDVDLWYLCGLSVHYEPTDIMKTLVFVAPLRVALGSVYEGCCTQQIFNSHSFTKKCQLAIAKKVIKALDVPYLWRVHKQLNECKL